jgi:hypothetical protein
MSRSSLPTLILSLPSLTLCFSSPQVPSLSPSVHPSSHHLHLPTPLLPYLSSPPSPLLLSPLSDHPYTALVPSLSGGVDPDDVFSKVPYEKGFWFLYYLQVCVCVYVRGVRVQLQHPLSHTLSHSLSLSYALSHSLSPFQELVGGQAAFLPFLRAYLAKFRFSTASSDEFKAFFLDHFKGNKEVEKVRGEEGGGKECECEGGV